MIKIKLKIPPQDIPAFNHFKLDSEGASSWIAPLVTAGSGSAVTELSQALDELNRHALSPLLRYQITEVLRPAVDATVTALSRPVASRSSDLPGESTRRAEQADRLLTLIGTAYTISTIETIQNPDAIEGIPPAQLACESLYRAIGCSGQQILQSLKIYRPLHMQGWLTLHQLYALAENQQLTELPVPNPLDSGTSISTAYLQAILIACCNPNQMRQSDLNALFSSLAHWSELATIKQHASDSDLFLVDLQSDQPPQHRAFYHQHPSDDCRFINTSALLDKLKKLEIDSKRVGIERNSRLPTNIIKLLITALGSRNKRNFKRSRSHGQLTVAIGLNNAHFYLAGTRVFEQVLYGKALENVPEGSNPEFSESRPHADIWHEANPAEDFLPSELAHPDQDIQLDAISRSRVLRTELKDEFEVDTNEYPSYELQLTDVSPGGYCLEWDESVIGDLRNGDIVSIRESHSEQWSVAAIRWLSRVERNRSLLGLELLSPKAVAYGACIHDEAGHKTAAMRTLLLPEIKVVGQPQTLVTPRSNFLSGQKVTVTNNSENFNVQLTEMVDATGSYARFEFELVKDLSDRLSEQGVGVAGENDSSLWTTL